MISIGKFTNYSYKDKISEYNDVHLDMLWFLMNLNTVQRFVTPASFQEFLVRLFLIRDKNFDEYALDIIDDELIIDGFISEQYFCLTIGDLTNLIGFSCSDARYNIRGSIQDFASSYKFELPNIKFSKNENKENTYNITKDVLVFALAGVVNLVNLESCSLKFKENLEQINTGEIDKANKLANFIVNRLPTDLFSKYHNDFPIVKQKTIERYLKSDRVVFDIFKEIESENLALIYEIIIDKKTADRFREIGEDEDLKIDLSWFNELIKFAYGVKHGYIGLSDYYNSLFTEVDPLFDLEFENIFGEDNETYSTNYYYKWLEMEKWQHLLP